MGGIIVESLVATRKGVPPFLDAFRRGSYGSFEGERGTVPTGADPFPVSTRRRQVLRRRVCGPFLDRVPESLPRIFPRPSSLPSKSYTRHTRYERFERLARGHYTQLSSDSSCWSRLVRSDGSVPSVVGVVSSVICLRSGHVPLQCVPHGRDGRTRDVPRQNGRPVGATPSSSGRNTQAESLFRLMGRDTGLLNLRIY